MRNKVKENLDAGKPAVVLSGHLTPDSVDLLGPLGYDGIWLEGEHGPYSWGDIGHFARACELWEMALIVRMNSNDPAAVMRTLDLGANGIIMPHVNTKEEAQRVVDGAKYQPFGHRGIGGGRSSYGDPHYLKTANDKTFVSVMIEDVIGIQNLGEILSVPYIDSFFVARHDLAQTMGRIGEAEHPEVHAAADKAFTRIVAAGKNPGSTATLQSMESQLKKGIKFFMVNTDAMLTATAGNYLKQFRAMAK